MSSDESSSFRPSSILGIRKQNTVKLGNRKSILTPIVDSYNKESSVISKLNQNARYFNLPQGYIKGSKIKVMSFEDMKALSIMNITTSEMSGRGSVNDEMLGVLNPIQECPHCKERDCIGHYGLITFPKHSPVIHPSYVEAVTTILQIVCSSCGELIINKQLLKDDGVLNMSATKRLEYFKEFVKSSDILKCPTEPGENDVPCASNLEYKTIPVPIVVQGTKAQYVKTVGYEIRKKDKKKTKENDHRKMEVTEILNIFQSISDEDAEIILGKGCHPKDLILKGILVPPNIIRKAGQKDNKLSKLLADIAKECITEKTDSIRLKAFVDNLILTNGAENDEKTSYLDMIQGKQGIIRNSLMGKNTEHIARAPVGPDISLAFGQFGLPETYAKALTIPFTVTKYNINYIKEQWENKGYILFVTPKKTRTQKKYQIGKTDIQVGDIIERRLLDGDVIVVGRNPTLHRESMMGYVIKIVEGIQLKLHLSCTTPMNCDFDGDENNCFIPQSIQSRIEALLVMNTKNCIMGSENSKPNIGLVMNSITMSYLLSINHQEISPSLFKQVIKKIEQSKEYTRNSFNGSNIIIKQDVNQLDTLYDRLSTFGIKLNTGQAVISALFPCDFYYKKGDVLIINGVLISGKLTKSIVGPSGNGIIQHLYKQYGYVRTAEFITAATWVCSLYSRYKSFSIGMSDFYIYEEDKDGNIVDICDAKVKDSILKMRTKLKSLDSEDYDKNDPIQSTIFESKVKDIVDVAGSIGKELAIDILGDKTRLNTLGVMTDQGAGTKGSSANVGQIMGSVGQQQHDDQRLPLQISHKTRTLPCFDINDKRPESRGFVDKSFKDGVNPTGLFNVQYGGRGPLLDTAMQTVETGTINHRMVKAFENTQIEYDYSMRNMIGGIILPLYNSGIDPKDVVMDGGRESFVNLEFEIMKINAKYGYVKYDGKKIEQENMTLKTDKYKPIVEELYPTPVFNRYEYVRLIGTRAMQIESGIPPLINTELIDPIYIAMEEYKQGLLSNFGVIRKYTDGSYDKKKAPGDKTIKELDSIMERVEDIEFIDIKQNEIKSRYDEDEYDVTDSETEDEED
jgi:DNA-directed RNA polymerase beta' subunit/DNA-directed RNA polymerase subunit K/omega